MLLILFSQNKSSTIKIHICFAYTVYIYTWCLFLCWAAWVMRATDVLQVILSGDNSGDILSPRSPRTFHTVINGSDNTHLLWLTTVTRLWPFTARLRWGGVHVLLCVTMTMCECVYVLLRGFTEVESPSCNTPHDSQSRYDKVIWPLW